MIRRIVFWAHLSAGVVLGVFVLLMSATGVVLTYERQMVAMVERGALAPPQAGQAPLSADALAAAVQADAVTLVFERAAGAPVRAEQGRRDVRLIDPYTGATLESDAGALRGFFAAATNLHRWLAMEGEGRDTGRAINDAANLVFFFMLITGAYLWLPKVWNAATLRVRVWLHIRNPTAKARDYNWHHALGLWALAPLLVIVATGIVFSYPAANRAVFAAFGEEAPVRGGPPGGGERGGRGGANAPAPVVERAPDALQRVLENAQSYDPRWRRISLAVDGASDEIRAVVDTGSGGEPQRRTTLVYRDGGATPAEVQAFGDMTPGRQARSLMRFLHTGEALGLAGQTIAGLASLAACLMVWTGFALAYRRLITPLFRRKRA